MDQIIINYNYSAVFDLSITRLICWAITRSKERVQTIQNKQVLFCLKLDKMYHALLTFRFPIGSTPYHLQVFSREKPETKKQLLKLRYPFHETETAQKSFLAWCLLSNNLDTFKLNLTYITAKLSSTAAVTHHYCYHFFLINYHYYYG